MMTKSDSDPLWSAVKLLLFNNSGANGSQVFIDQSLSNRPVTTYGNTAWSTAAPPQGLSSSAFGDGVGDYISVPYAQDLDLGRTAGNKCIEAYVKVSTNWDPIAIFSSYNGSNSVRFTVQPHATNSVIRLMNNSDFFLTVSGIPMTLGAWHHVAGYNVGTSFYIAVNGVIVASKIGHYWQIVAGTFIYVGVNENDFNYWKGGIAGLRVTNDATRYTGANFIPPTLPLPTS